MRLSAKQFLSAENWAITLLGMSGVGKTTLANKLPKEDWFHYSGDYRIGTKYLEEPILDNIKRQAMQVGFLRDLLRSDSIFIASNITVHNLEPISSFLGKVGNPVLGGLPLKEFRRRQDLHHEGEVGAMHDCEAFIAKAIDIYGYRHFVNDAGGSLCELTDPSVMPALAANSIIIYIEADADMERQLIERQRHSPKPLYYQSEFFERELATYIASNDLRGADEIVPDDFVQWIFPRLVEHRRPAYQRITREHGYTVAASDIETVRDQSDFAALISQTLEQQSVVVPSG
ncbi:MAG: hypothetical protein ACI8PT_000597 [Gammaproteobacteria bacterium]|jgi:hypothetical protein